MTILRCGAVWRRLFHLHNLSHTVGRNLKRLLSTSMWTSLLTSALLHVYLQVDAHATASKEEGRGEDGLTLQQRVDNGSREFWNTLSGVVPDSTVSKGFSLHTADSEYDYMYPFLGVMALPRRILTASNETRAGADVGSTGDRTAGIQWYLGRASRVHRGSSIPTKPKPGG